MHSQDQEAPWKISHRIFITRFLIGLLLIGLALLLVKLADVFLLVFGAALIAIIFRSIADPISRRLHVPSRLSLLLSVLLVLGLLGFASWLFGREVAAQASSFRDMLPEAWRSFEQRVGDTQLGERIIAGLEDASTKGGEGVASDLGGYLITFGAGIADLLLVLIAGIFLAAEPRLYRRGVLKLFPRDRHEQIDDAMESSGKALRKWLLGQLVSMSIIGVFTGLGLWLIGVPSALMLGLVAGLAEFVPLLGPFVAAVPGLLIALSVGPETALWALAVYVGIQQIESNLITPLVERWAVSIPPVVTLFGVLCLGLIFGLVGVLLAAPLTVVLYVLVKKLYVRDTLGNETQLPGEEAPSSG